MFTKRVCCLINVLLLFMTSFSQGSRKLDAVRTTLPIQIDGSLQDEAWKMAAVVDSFIEQRPVFGQKENELTRTEIWILYDDEAVYVSGFCHEPGRDSISTELLGRDQLGVNDFAGVMFDTYLDQINGVGFYVTALGEQVDVKYSLGNEDDSWSTVFFTATNINEKGWTFEMKIPYSALRFSKQKVQSWGVNFVRRRTKSGKQFNWSPIDPNKFGLMSQAGVLTNIQNIKSPIRLSFSPYFSSYLTNNPNSSSGSRWQTSINGGMDVKYGLSKGFTLDMTLIPDFGQVQSDDQILNLTPFEVRYNENRPFFTEGIELFNKGNLFYSRRIGGSPVNQFDLPGLKNGDVVLENPAETKLVNATKISGRTAKGLGVGFFNAITKPQYASVRDSSGQFDYKLETNPWTNYNIVVLDQTMKNNSSITLVNTNVLRSGPSITTHDYDANVTAFLFDLYDKKVDWNTWGKLANSRLISKGKNISGYNYEINLGKFKGPFNFEVHQFAADPEYNHNDLGYFTNNNYYDNGFGAWYRVTKPKGFYNRMYFQMSANYSQQYKPRRFQYVSVNAYADAQTKKLWTFGLNANVTPQQQDFYEPRYEGRLFKRPASWRAGTFMNTNAAKKYSVSIELNMFRAAKYNNNSYDFYINNQYRFNSKFSVSFSVSAGFDNSNLGFAFIKNDPVSPSNDSIFFGIRDRNTVINTLNLKYNFNTKMGLTFRARHYWSKVHYKRFLLLNAEGYAEDANPQINDQNNPDNNANFFNIDMVYTWQFAQGSFINVAWKDASQLFDRNVQDQYAKNFNQILSNPQQTNFSVKVIYYLDYLSLKKRKKKQD